MFLRTDIPAKLSMCPAATFRGKQCETSTIVQDLSARYMKSMLALDQSTAMALLGPRPPLRALIVTERS
jgi:hypothetical protein